MPYVKFNEFPISTNGRTLTSGVADPVTGEYFAFTDEVLDTDTVVTDAEYAKVLAAAEAAYEAEQAAKPAEADQE